MAQRSTKEVLERHIELQGNYAGQMGALQSLSQLAEFVEWLYRYGMNDEEGALLRRKMEEFDRDADGRAALRAPSRRAR